MTRRRAMTLIEIVVALTISTLLVAAIGATFVTILKIARESEVQIGAAANARAALETMSKEIKSIFYIPLTVYFRGENILAEDDSGDPYGDGYDNDTDGDVDEEEPNALDDDGDWTVGGDRHSSGTLVVERGNFVGVADLGDMGVDEDNLFHHDTLAFTAAPPLGAGYKDLNIRYSIETYEDTPHVLVRATTHTLANNSSTTTLAPIAYNVLSFNCLYWNPNASPLPWDPTNADPTLPPSRQYWLEEWDSASPPGPGPSTTFRIPAAVLVEIVVHADPKPIEVYKPGDRVRVLAIRSVVNIESVTTDWRFPRRP